jgi:hypothetical protein
MAPHGAAGNYAPTSVLSSLAGPPYEPPGPLCRLVARSLSTGVNSGGRPSDMATSAETQEVVAQERTRVSTRQEPGACSSAAACYLDDRRRERRPRHNWKKRSDLCGSLPGKCVHHVTQSRLETQSATRCVSAGGCNVDLRRGGRPGMRRVGSGTRPGGARRFRSCNQIGRRARLCYPIVPFCTGSNMQLHCDMR